MGGQRGPIVTSSGRRAANVLPSLRHLTLMHRVKYESGSTTHVNLFDPESGNYVMLIEVKGGFWL